MSTSTGGVAYTTLLQRRTPACYRGRVFSAFNVAWQGGRLASLALAGILVDAMSVQALYVGAGALLVLAGLVGLRAMHGARYPSIGMTRCTIVAQRARPVQGIGGLAQVRATGADHLPAVHTMSTTTEGRAPGARTTSAGPCPDAAPRAEQVRGQVT